MSLTTELLALFDRETVEASQRLTPDLVDAKAVGLAARELLALTGNPRLQIERVRALPPLTAQALCRWIRDPGFWSAVGRISSH